LPSPQRSLSFIPIVFMLSARLVKLPELPRSSVPSLRSRSSILLLDFQPFLCNLMRSVSESVGRQIIATAEVINRPFVTRIPFARLPDLVQLANSRLAAAATSAPMAPYYFFILSATGSVISFSLSGMGCYPVNASCSEEYSRLTWSD
jgi:hypothetical protein